MTEEKLAEYTRVFTFINVVAWAIVGITLVVAIVLYFFWGPSKFWQEITGNANFSSYSSSSSNYNGGSGTRSGGSSRYTQQEIECGKRVLGEARVNQIINNNETPTKEEQKMVMQCVSSGQR